MKRPVLFFILVCTIAGTAPAQGIKDLFDKAATKDSSGVLKTISKGVSGSSGNLSNEEIINGLRES